MTAETPRTDERAGDQMALAIRAMAHHAGQASRVDRTGWTQQQWADDARALMGDIDGSVSSLVNGHVTALIDEADRLAAAVARAEAAEAKVAAALALCGDCAVFADFGEPPNEDVVAGVREADLLAALGSATTEGPPPRLRAAGGDRMTPNSLRAHNHAPYRPSCDEREVSGRVRGACLNDDGSDR